VEEGAEMLAETLMALAALAGNTVVAAAITNAWEAARRGLALAEVSANACSHHP
jgi:hypothetical protein